VNKVHEIFPLIVYQGTIDCHEKFKEQNLETLCDYWFNGYENESPEVSGNIFSHLNDDYSMFYESLKKCIVEYFDHLKVNHTLFDFHVVKSWVGYHKDDDTPSIPTHFHNESNISFVYYLKTDESSDKFCVSQESNRNEVSGGLFETSDKFNTLFGFNRYNCNHYNISPIEGSVLLFPSDLLHGTQKIGERKDERIVIAGDIRVTLKPEHFRHHQGCTHPSQWLEI
jgi:hypothetical protein